MTRVRSMSLGKGIENIENAHHVWYHVFFNGIVEYFYLSNKKTQQERSLFCRCCQKHDACYKQINSDKLCRFPFYIYTKSYNREGCTGCGMSNEIPCTRLDLFSFFEYISLIVMLTLLLPLDDEFNSY